MMAKQDGKTSGLQKQLSNIFAEVQEKLPSLDFDLSDVSSDEEMGIFNRSLKSTTTVSSREDVLSPTSWQSALVIDGNQEEEEYNLNNSQTVDVESWDRMDNVGTCFNGLHVADDGDECLLGRKTSNDITALSDVTLTWTENSKCDTSKGSEDTSERDVNKCPPVIEGKGDLDKREMMMKNFVSKEDNRIVSRFITSQAPVPDFQRVEERHLDQLLNNLPIDSSSDNPQLDVQVQRTFSKIKDENNSAENAASLMEKLTKLCVMQASQVKATTLSNTMANRSIGSNIGNCQRKLMSTSISTGVSTGISTSVSTETFPVTSCSKGVSTDTSSNNANSKKANRGTIYLDLREKEESRGRQATKVIEPVGLGVIQRILGLKAAVGVSEESDDNDDVIDWQKQRKQIRAALIEGQSLKSYNDLPIPRKMFRTSKVTAPPRVMHLPPKEVFESRPKKMTKKLESKCLVSRAVDLTTGSDVANDKGVKSGAEIRLSDKDRKQQEADLKRLRKQREEEKAAKHRLQKQLEALKPTLSIGGKSQSCSATDVLFDVEASYTQVPDCLPPVAKYNGETLLLSVCLTSCLQMKANSSAGGRIIDSHLQGMSATYITLLSWLLSCVPQNFDFLKMSPEVVESGESLPFFVVGLQQILLDSELMLVAAIRPTGQQTPLTTKHKRKKKELKRNCSQFELAITEFLNKNTLHSVCPSAEKAFSLIISSNGAPCILSNQSQDRLLPDGTYIPELPYISSKPLSTFICVQSNADAIERVFKAPVGFFWQTLESEYLACDTASSESYDNDNNIQNTISLIYKSIYRDQTCMLSILNRIIHEGVDICGVRLVYTPEDMSLEVPAASFGRKQTLDSPRSGSDQVIIDDLNNVGPILVFALRGAKARQKWLNIVGPSDPQLARRTDPKSLIALFGGDSRSEVAIYCPRNQDRVNYELSLWFGGRVPPNGVVDVGSSVSKSQKHRNQNNKKKQAKNSYCEDDVGECNEDEVAILSSVPPVLLTASTSSDIFLVVSPIIPPMCVGTILSTCCERGFQLRGLRRLRLNSKRTSVLGMTGIQARVFSPVSCTTPTSPQNYDQLLREQIEHGFATATPSPMPSLVVLLRRENAYGQGYSLIEALMVHLALQGLLLDIQRNISTKLTSIACFHIAPYSESLMANLGGDICRVADSERHVSLLNQGTFYTNPELEQVVAVTLVGIDVMKLIGGYLDKMLGFSTTGIELLGIKWLPSLTSAQAKEITPFEVGDRHWHSSLQAFTSNPVVICIMRGVDAFQRLQYILGINLNMQIARSNSPRLEKLVSPTAELAYRQTIIFFSDRELFSDCSVRMNLQYQPPLRNPSLEAISTARFTWADDLVSPTTGKSRGRGGKPGKKSLVVEESVFKSMTAGPRPITTIAVIKPDSVKRNLVKILKYMTREGFKVVSLRLLVMSLDQAMALIPIQYKQNDKFIEAHNEVLTSRPSMIVCLQRENGVKKLLDLCGPVDPKDCRTINQFLWRGIFGNDVVRNGLHVSHSYSAAVHEEKLFFPAGLCCHQTQDLLADGIQCPPQGDLICDGNGGRKFVVKESVVKNNQNEKNVVFQAAHSGLCETTCVVLTPPRILLTNQKNQNIYVDILEKLVVSGFQVMGARMMWQTEAQAVKVVNLFKCSLDKLVPVLSKGPTLVLALQRDNAVTCWESILKSSVASSEILTKYSEQILRPATLLKAHNALGFFFDELCSSCQGEIVHEMQE